jgi:hypothetical protein
VGASIMTASAAASVTCILVHITVSIIFTGKREIIWDARISANYFIENYIFQI